MTQVLPDPRRSESFSSGETRGLGNALCQGWLRVFNEDWALDEAQIPCKKTSLEKGGHHVDDEGNDDRSEQV